MSAISQFFIDLTIWLIVFFFIYLIAGIQTIVIVIALGLFFKYAERVAKDAEKVQKELKR